MPPTPNSPSALVPKFVYKILLPKEWKALESVGRFEGSVDDKRDGFIHLSCAEQVEATISKHFSEARDLVIAKVASGSLPIKMEVSRGNARFPHLYGTLERNDVVSITRRL